MNPYHRRSSFFSFTQPNSLRLGLLGLGLALALPAGAQEPAVPIRDMPRPDPIMLEGIVVTGRDDSLLEIAGSANEGVV